jgi:hypothetical protein
LYTPDEPADEGDEMTNVQINDNDVTCGCGHKVRIYKNSIVSVSDQVCKAIRSACPDCAA